MEEQRLAQEPSAGTGDKPLTTNLEMVRGLVNSFATNPGMAGRTLRDFAEKAPQRFYEPAVKVLQEETPPAGRNFLIGLLMEKDMLWQALADPHLIVREKAIDLTRHLQRTYPMMESQLLRYVLHGVNGPGVATLADWARLERVLGLLAKATNTPRLIAMLANLLRNASKPVRLKAAPVIIRCIRHAQWLKEMLHEEDVAVRLAAVECYLGVKPSGEELAVMQKIASDEHHQVATTALVVIYLHGDANLAKERLLDFTHHPDPKFRAATAWAMGKLNNPEFLPHLQRMVRDDQGEVKREALLACVALRKDKHTNEAA